MTKKEKEFLINWLRDFNLETKRIEAEAKRTDQFLIMLFLFLAICVFNIVGLSAYGSILAIVFIIHKIVEKIFKVKRSLDVR